MKRKKIGGSIALIAVAVIGVVIVAYFLVKPTYDRYVSEKEFLAPFHEVYGALREKFPSITLLHEDIGAGGRYGMYYIECDIDENTDCFAEFVDIQCEINALMEARKEDEWFSEFDGHIVIIAGSRRLRAFYHNGSISKEFWANNMTSGEYAVLWDAFPEIDDIYLVIWLDDYSDEIASEIMRKNEGRNIKVEPQLGS